MSAKKYRNQTRRSFKRPRGEKRYKVMFLIATEGLKTEVQYFSGLKSKDNIVRIELIKGDHSDPENVLKRLRKKLKNESLRKNDQAWLVVDKDLWKESSLEKLCAWTEESPKYHLALSNPKFEYWLLLHFENGKGVSRENCDKRLKKHIPDYDKGIDFNKFRPNLETAIKHAKDKDILECKKWPKGNGSTVYRLVEEILKAQRQN